jgi:hypothetical protein
MKASFLLVGSWLSGSLGAALLVVACMLSTPIPAIADNPPCSPDPRCRTCGTSCPGWQPPCNYICHGPSCPRACTCKKQYYLCYCDL